MVLRFAPASRRAPNEIAATAAGSDDHGGETAPDGGRAASGIRWRDLRVTSARQTGAKFICESRDVSLEVISGDDFAARGAAELTGGCRIVHEAPDGVGNGARTRRWDE